MGLPRGRQHLGIVALLADFILQGGGWSADEVLQFIRRQHREVPVCEKISPVLLISFHLSLEPTSLPNKLSHSLIAAISKFPSASNILFVDRSFVYLFVPALNSTKLNLKSAKDIKICMEFYSNLLSTN